MDSAATWCCLVVGALLLVAVVLLRLVSMRRRSEETRRAEARGVAPEPIGGPIAQPAAAVPETEPVAMTWSTLATVSTAIWLATSPEECPPIPSATM